MNTFLVSKIKKMTIFISYRCNNRCIFCYNSYKRNYPSMSAQRIIRELRKARERGVTYLEITGGEPSIREDIILIIKLAKKMGFQTIAMATNGVKFSDKEFAKKAIESGLNHLIFSIHGHKSKLHDLLTGKEGNFKKLMKGIENVLQLGLKDIGTNTVIIKQNYKYLFEIGKLIYSIGIRNAEFIFVDPTQGFPSTYFSKLVPKLEEILPSAKKCLEIGREHKVEHWHIRYVPICLFRDYKSQISELNEVQLFTTEHIASDFYNMNVEDSRPKNSRIKPWKCLNCKEYSICEGIWYRYYLEYGDEELKPYK